MTNIDILARNKRLRQALATLSDEHLSVVLEVAESGDALQIEGSARFVLHRRQSYDLGDPDTGDGTVPTRTDLW